jgi:hypothetical protein
MIWVLLLGFGKNLPGNRPGGQLTSSVVIPFVKVSSGSL